jgi:hypothetical protein
LREALRGQDVVIDHRVSMPPTFRAALPGARRTFRYLRDEATARLVDAMLDVGVERLIRDLVTFVYADAGGHWIGEDTPVAASGAMAANLDAERQIERLTTAGAAARVQARSQRVSAARFHEATGWNPTVPRRRHGWPAAFERIR